MTKRRLGMLLTPFPFDDNSRRIMRGVIQYVREQGGWEVVTRNAIPSITWEELPRFRGDGLISMVFNTEQYEKLLRKRLPCANVCALIETPRLPTVYSDNPQIGRLAGETLWRTGVRKFAFVGQPQSYHDRRRSEGFRAFLQERGADCELIELDLLPDHPRDWGTVDSNRIAPKLRRLPRPIGIFAATDPVGCQVLAICRAEGIHVPHEAAVLGVSDLSLLCETAEPPLSSIRQQAERTGYEAARLLTKIIEGQAESTSRIRLPPGEVIERCSTNTLMVADPEVREALVLVRNRLEQPITVDDIAEQLALSRRSLDKRCVAAIGRTLAGELRHLRIRRGRDLLGKTDLSVTEVAAWCGFQTASSFDRAFREATGLTPREYRKKYGELAIKYCD